MTEKEIQGFVKALKSADAEKALLIIIANSRITLKSNHPDYRRLGYALAKVSENNEQVNDILNDLLHGMNDYIVEEDTKTMKVPICSETKYRS